MIVRLAWVFVGAAALVVGCGDGGSTGFGGSPPIGLTTGVGGAGGATGTGGSGASGGGTTGIGGGATGDPCAVCTDMNDVFDDGTPCATSLAACQADPVCAEWLSCNANCLMTDFTAGCFEACDLSASSASQKYEPITACICSACAPSCAPLCP